YIGSNALKAHGNRLDVHAKNIANIDTPNYVRKIPVLNTIKGDSFGAILNNMQDGTFGLGSSGALQGGVSYGGIVEDPTPGERIYKPGHPDADANGYIRSSNVNAMVDIADAMMAQRAYEANLAVMNITKAMAMKAAEIGK
ncbi:flagellar basal body rod protein FlgC, partial [bacterium]|nr:flagellar basal body rod protein FlgC [bacterium]